MKRLLIITSSIFFITLSASFFFVSDYSVLSIKDIFMMIKDNRTPELTTLDDNKEHFNRWQCFRTKDIEISEADVNYNGWHKVPSINVKTQKVFKSFDLDPDIKLDTEAIINKWKLLIEKQRSICIFGVFLQKEADGSSLWYINMIKTKKGYWDRLEINPS